MVASCMRGACGEKREKEPASRKKHTAIVGSRLLCDRDDDGSCREPHTGCSALAPSDGGQRAADPKQDILS